MGVYPVPTILKRLSITKAVAIVALYWVGLFLLSILTFDSPVPQSIVLPALLLAGIPILVAAGVCVWRAGNVKVADLAFLDDLTGLSNRRAFTRKATLLIRQSKPGSASLILLDVDGLKNINDQCGHQAGDELLEQVARHLSNASKTVYRVGGDEFAILVDRTEGESVTALMRSLTPLAHSFKACGHQHVIQFSYGFASRREQETFDEIYSRADARLRQFKHRLYSSGRLQERRMTQVSAKAELERVIAEAEQDDAHSPADDGTVISIFSRTARANATPPDSRSGSGL